MKRLLAIAVALAALALPGAVAAHPLGNFTVNRAAEVTVSGDRVYLRYVLDLAEIPALQEGDRVRRPGFAASLSRSLVLRVDGRRTALRPLATRVAELPGAGGLATLRFEAVYDAGPAGTGVAFADETFVDRIGWREVVVRADRGAQVERSTAPAESPSLLLLAYPKDLLKSPLDVRSASADVRPGELSGLPPELTDAAPPRAAEGLARLVSGDLGVGFVLVSLILALFWGAAHALEPGHGKAIVAGFLIGSRGTPRHAVLLGLIVTVTHTIGVLALGLVTLALSELIVPETLYPWLNLVSALLVVSVGLAILRWRVGSWRHARAHAHGHSHAHDHEHAHPGRGLLGIGISAGIIPCPTALVVLLAAISLHRIGYGLVLIVAFSIGLAAAVTSIGLVAVTARRTFSRLSFDGPLVSALPAVSALVVIALGLAMTARALPTLL
ncbi:MAG: sulfite exporter TauE/SafE family protein [Gaiellaceae bacterium]